MWIKEISVKFTCKPKSLNFYCNNRGNVIELTASSSCRYLRLFTKDFRLTFSNGKLFDFNNLSTKKGKDAITEINSILNSLKPGIVEDLNENGLRYEIPISLLKNFVENLNVESVSPERYLDFNIDYIDYDIGRDFLKNSPRFESERRLKMSLSINNKCLRVIYWLDSSNVETFSSEDCVNWTSNTKIYTIVSNISTFDERYLEIKRFLEKITANNS
ncbi:MAG: hypothetical protein RRE78_02655 [Acidianus sp.]|nr:hypothetical protein [Acidianus sp.]